MSTIELTPKQIEQVVKDNNSISIYEIQSLAQDLFAALDDEVKACYYEYQENNGEYPSKFSIEALNRALNYSGFKSMALEEMNKNLAKDIRGEQE